MMRGPSGSTRVVGIGQRSAPRVLEVGGVDLQAAGVRLESTSTLSDHQYPEVRSPSFGGVVVTSATTVQPFATRE